MATIGAMAARDQIARERVSAATSALAERFGVTIQAVPFIRDPQMARIVALEAHADLLEALVEKGGDPVSPAAEIVEDAAVQGVALGVEANQQGEPVVVTETVDGEVANSDKADAAKMGEIHAAHEASITDSPGPNPTVTNAKPAPKKGKG